MNAARPVFQAAPSNEPPALSLSPNAPTAASSPPADAKSQDFAGALTEAHAKPDYKSGSHKSNSSSTSGSPLPAAGNPSPPPALPPAVPRAAAAPTTTPQSIAVQIGSVPVPMPNVGALAPTGVEQALAPTATEENSSGDSASASATPAAANSSVALPPMPPIAPANNESSVDPDLPTTATEADTPTAITATPASTPAPIEAFPTAPTRAAELNATATRNTDELQKNAFARNNPAAQADTTSQDDLPTHTDAVAAAGSAPPTNPASATGAPPSDAGAAAAQAIIANMIQSSDTRVPNPAATADDLAPAAASGAAPTAVVAALASRPAASSAAVAARVASSAQVVSALAGAGAMDRHAHAGAAPIDMSSGAAQATAGTSASTDVAPAPTLNVAAGVDSAEFGQGVADRVSLMVDSNLTSAKLQVNPPALGPIEVKIALQGGHAQVWLTSHSAVTRDALESSSPKLREMLGAQGFAQVSVDISQRSFQDRTPPSRGYELMPSVDDGTAPALTQVASASRSANGLLDAYA